MRKKFALFVFVLVSIVCISGCHYFVPGAVKRQTNLVSLDVNRCLEDIETIESDESKSEEQKLKEVRETAMRTLIRIKPQVQNIDDYTHGRPASPIEDKR